MKRIILSLLILMGLGSQVSAQFDISMLTNKSPAVWDEQLAPVTKLLATGLNTGIYVPTSCKLLSIGVQGFGLTYDKKGVFKTLTLPAIPVPAYVFAGARIPFIGISAYARGMYLPVPNLPIKFYGAGLGYDKTFLVFINLKAVASYNALSIESTYSYKKDTTETKMKGTISFNAASLNIYGTLAKIPLVKPYAFVGISKNSLNIKGNVDFYNSDTLIFSNPTNYTNPLFTAHLGAGVHLFKILSVEANLLPKMSISASLGFSL